MPRKVTGYRLLVTGFLTVLFVMLPVTCCLSPVLAQSSIADVYDISDKNTKTGDIVIFTPDKGITRTNIPYDIHLFGVYEASPTAVYKRVDGSGSPIVRVGISNINVTTLAGSIKAGDRITSSEIQGFGKKADTSGQVIGVSTVNFSDQDGQAMQFQGRTIHAGQIPVAVKSEYAELSSPRDFNRLFSYLGTNLLQNIQDPKQFGQAIKYIFSGLIILVAIIFSMIILLRSIPKSIEAIGRNPLARRAIVISIALNIAIVIILTIGAIAAALVILRL